MRLGMTFASLLALAACAGPDQTSRDLPIAAEVSATVPLDLPAVAVTVPPDLVVSEAEGFYPFADIVWRGDPPGDRLTQIRAMFEEAAAQVRAEEGGPQGAVGIEVVRFHGLTEEARRRTGGVYGIRFLLTLRDPGTGALLGEPRQIDADLRKFGAWHASFAEAKGITERQMLVSHLAAVLRAELSRPALSERAETD